MNQKNWIVALPLMLFASVLVISIANGQQGGARMPDAQSSGAPHTGDDATKKSDSVRVRVQVEYKDRPVSGATIQIQNFDDSESVDIEPVLTNADGIAVLLVPKLAKEPSSTEVSVRVTHHEHCEVNRRFIAIQNGFESISMPPSYRVLVDAVDAKSRHSIAGGLLASNGSGPWGAQENGRLLSPPIEIARYNGGRSCFRLVHIREDGSIGFSDVVGVYPRIRRRGVHARAMQDRGVIQKTKVPIYDSVSLSGRIDNRVPRPVIGGRAMIVLSATEKKGNSHCSLDWCDWTPIETDGSFRFDALPRNGKAKLMAISDGFVSESTLGEPDPFGWNLEPVEYELGDQDMNIAIRMVPTAKAKIRLLDPSSNPVQNATVKVFENQRWFCSLGEPLHQRVRTLDRLQNRPIQDYQWVSAVTDEYGIADLKNLVPASYAILVEHSDFEWGSDSSVPWDGDADVSCTSGKTTELSIQLVRKGTKVMQQR